MGMPKGSSFSEEHRKRISEGQKKRWKKRKAELKSKPNIEKEKGVNSNGHIVLDANDYESIKEVLHNCALAGLSLTRLDEFDLNNPYSIRSIKDLGSAIGEVCLEGIQILKETIRGEENAEKNETDDPKSLQGTRPEATATGEPRG